MDTHQLSYESIIDELLKQFPKSPGNNHFAIDWDTFTIFEKIVSNHFTIPQTHISSFMAQFLYALAQWQNPRSIVGAGTYVGYAFACLLGKRKSVSSDIQYALALDTDQSACQIARKNLSYLGHHNIIDVQARDAITALREQTTATWDLLYIDIDDPNNRKHHYTEVLQAALHRLNSGAMILAHDPCVPKFETDFQRYHNWINQSDLFTEVLVFPVDSCGLSVTFKK